VVKQADQVSVNLKDGRTFDGKVLGADSVTDLAAIKIEGNDLPTAKLGNSDEVRVGDWAIAVGNPLGLDNTVTLGIISTLNRPSAKVGIPDKRLDFLQTDAAINPGNSGGPLLNDRGEVIGINTAIRADANGIGFAIPVNKAKSIYPRLVEGRNVSHPYIGIRMVTLNPDLAKEINNDPNSGLLIPEVEGVLVMQVQQNTPAEQSGLRRGDVITKIEGTRITSAEQLQRVVENSNVGQRLNFTVRRGNQVETVAVYPAELDDFS
jgi:S1-C subfamily serine protease